MKQVADVGHDKHLFYTLSHLRQTSSPQYNLEKRKPTLDQYMQFLVLSSVIIMGFTSAMPAPLAQAGATSAEELAIHAAQAGRHWHGAIVSTGRTLGKAGEVAWQGTTTGARAVGSSVATGARAVGNGVATGARAVGSGVATGARAVGNGVVAVGTGVKNAAGAGIKAVQDHPGIFIAGAGGIGVGALIEGAATHNSKSN